jgi:hypothetical protein
MKKLFSVRTIILAGSLLLQLSILCFHSRGAAVAQPAATNAGQVSVTVPGNVGSQFFRLKLP